MGLVFINCTGEAAFNATHGGAISTWVWEVCQVAQRDGTMPLVITRQHTQPPYPWPNMVLLSYPVPRRLGFKGDVRLQNVMFQMQKARGEWNHAGQQAYLNDVVRVLKERNENRGVFVLNNDLDTAVFLRDQFPEAFILHISHSRDSTGKRFLSKFATSVDVAAAVSDDCRIWNEQHFGFKPGEMYTLLNGVNIEMFTPQAAAFCDSPIINFTGRICYEKGTDLILEAASQLFAEGHYFQIQLLGAKFFGRHEVDDYGAKLQSQIDSLRNRGIIVNWPGYVDRLQLPAMLTQAHIHVVPSRCAEAFGLTTVEGMASGLATVGSAIGGTPQVIGNAGLLFESDNSISLANCLRALLEDQNIRLEFSRKGRERALTFSWENTWKNLKKILPSSAF